MKVGDKIYYVSKERGQPYSALKETVITEVRRHTFSVLIKNKRIDINTMIDAHSSDPHNLYFLTKDDYYDYFERQKLVAEVKANINKINWNRVNKKDIVSIIELLSEYNF